jgi:hypothetical protein
MFDIVFIRSATAGSLGAIVDRPALTIVLTGIPLISWEPFLPVQMEESMENQIQLEISQKLHSTGML